MSLNRYKTIDLLIFAVIVTVMEIAVRLALKISPNEIFTFSSTLAVTLIVMVRWGPWGLIHGALGGIVFALVNGAESKVILCYGIGNLGAALALLVSTRVPGEQLRRKWRYIILYTVAGYAGMCIGRAAVAAVLEGNMSFFLYVKGYAVQEALNGVITLVVLYIAGRQNGVFENQISYLRRIAKEEELKNA